MSGSGLGLLLAVVGAGCAPRSAAPAAPLSAPALPARSFSVFGGGVVVSSTSATVYVMDVEGIVAIDLATGKPRWSSHVAAKPLAERGTELVALDESGALRVLDARTGQPYSACAVLHGVKLQLISEHGSSATSWGVSDGTRVWIPWSHSTSYAGGTPPPPDIEAQSRSHASGVFEVNVDTCTATSASDPFAVTRDGTGTRGVTDSGIAFDLSPALRLGRKRGTTALPELDLKQGKPFLRGFVTDDRQHVLVIRFSSGRSSPFELFEIERGLLIARGEIPMQVHVGAVVGGLIISRDNEAVSVFDPAAKRLLWTHAVRSLMSDEFPP